MILVSHPRRVWLEVTLTRWQFWPVWHRGQGALTMTSEPGHVRSVYVGPLHFFWFTPNE